MDLPIENGGSFHCCVSLPEGMPFFLTNGHDTPNYNENWEMMMVSGRQFDVFSMVDKLGCYPFGSVLLS